MQLTRHSDYSLRVLTFLALRSGEMATIMEIAEAYDISRAHLMKVVQRLGQLGYVETLRGRGGGLLLGRPAETIRLGELLRHTEENLDLVKCFSVPSGDPTCRIEPACKLKGIFAEALQSFLGTLHRYLFRARQFELVRATDKGAHQLIDEAQLFIDATHQYHVRRSAALTVGGSVS